MLSALDQKGLGPTTLRNVRNCLSAALMEAVEQQYIVTNPARVKVVDLRYRSNVDGSKRRIVAILKALEDHRYGDLYRMLIYTGMRIGEAVALDWGDIDKDRHTITVRRSLTREPLSDDPRRTRKVFGPTKTGRERTIPVSAEFLELSFSGWIDSATSGAGLVTRPGPKAASYFPQRRIPAGRLTHRTLFMRSRKRCLALASTPPVEAGQTP